jgi:hypothetical protein
MTVNMPMTFNMGKSDRKYRDPDAFTQEFIGKLATGDDKAGRLTAPASGPPS